MQILKITGKISGIIVFLVAGYWLEWLLIKGLWSLWIGALELALKWIFLIGPVEVALGLFACYFLALFILKKSDKARRILL